MYPTRNNNFVLKEIYRDKILILFTNDENIMRKKKHTRRLKKLKPHLWFAQYCGMKREREYVSTHSLQAGLCVVRIYTNVFL